MKNKKTFWIAILSLLCGGCLFTACDNGGAKNDILLPNVGNEEPLPPGEAGTQTDFIVNIDYGVFIEDKATTLLNGCTLFFSQEENPNIFPLLAGDVVQVCHTGVLEIQEIWPSSVKIVDGELLGVDKISCTIEECVYTVENGVTAMSGRVMENLPPYVINKDGSFYSIADLTEGTPLFVTFSPYGDMGAVYAYNPNPYATSRKASEFFPWIDSLTEENVTMAIKREEIAGLAPGSHAYIFKTTNEQELQSIVWFLQGLRLKKTDPVDVDGGLIETLTVCLGAEKEFSISYYCGLIEVDGATYLPYATIPGFIPDEGELYGFITYGTEMELYQNGDLIKTYEDILGKIIFKKANLPFDDNDKKYVLYGLKMDAVYLLNERTFSFNGACFEIVGDLDFTHIFKDFPLEENVDSADSVETPENIEGVGSSEDSSPMQ